MEGLKDVKLTYFGLNGRSMISKALLLYGKIPFENKQVSFQDWPTVKPTLELQFLPVLEANGKTFSQFTAINFYLAKKIGGLLGSSPEEEYEIMALFNSDADMAPLLFKITLPSEEDKKPENMKQNIDNLISKWGIFIKAFEARYIKNGQGKYFFGDKLSLADFFNVFFFGNNLSVVVKEAGEVLSKSYPVFFKYLDGLKEEDFAKNFFNSDLYIKGSL